MSFADNKALVESPWLAEHLADPDLRILDCTWHHVSTNLDGRTQYRGRHLPGAVHFDIDHVCDPSSSLPHMLPSASDFAKKVGLLGIGNDDRVVVYDRAGGGAAAARVWWMFRVFGHQNIAVLNGGLGKWSKEKRPAEMTPVRPEPTTYAAIYNPALVRSLDEMSANLATRAEQIIDAREAAQFAGVTDDLFASARRGHMPDAINIPWQDLLDLASETLLPEDALAGRFTAAGVDLDRPIVASCSSGIVSGIIALALYQLGCASVAIYDGAWVEWGSTPSTPAVAA
jgi:thiosulfate/3-mercaptopyruvate sulfurtransferase